MFIKLQANGQKFQAGGVNHLKWKRCTTSRLHHAAKRSKY